MAGLTSGRKIVTTAGAHAASAVSVAAPLTEGNAQAELERLSLAVGSSSGLPSNVLSKTANFTAADGDFILCNAAGGAFTITLPASGTVIVVKTDASANAVAVAGTINGDAGGASIGAQDYGSIFKSTATNVWRTIPGAPSGTDGADGADGAPGADGRTILNGTAVPTTEGVNGDFYLRTTTSVLYGPKTAGAWGSGTSLVGAAGTNGTNGTNGADGVITEVQNEGVALADQPILNFTGAGVDVTVSGGKYIADIPGGGSSGDTQAAVKTADQSVTSQPSLVDITGLDVAVGAAATETWVVDYTLVLSAASATPDIYLGFTVPAGCTMYWGVIGYSNGWMGNAVAGAGAALLLAAGIQSFGLSTPITGQIVRAVIKGGGTAGAVKIRFCQATSSVDATTVKAMSSMMARRVAA